MFLEQPRGLPQLDTEQLLKSKKAICGVVGARRLLENVFFTWRHDGELVAMALAHVEDTLLARDRTSERKHVLSSVDSKFRWTWYSGNFIFRGRQVSPGSEGIHVTMEDHAAALTVVEINRARRTYFWRNRVDCSTRKTRLGTHGRIHSSSRTWSVCGRSCVMQCGRE